MKWDRLEGPARALIWLALVAICLAIFRLAESLVEHIFAVALLFVFASIIAVVLTPVADLVQRIPGLRSRRWVAVLLLVLIFGLALAGLGVLLVPSLISQAEHVPQLAGKVEDQLRIWGISLDLRSLARSVTSNNLAGQFGLIGGVINSLVSVVLTIVIAIYLLIEGRTLVATARNAFPGHTQTFDFAVLAIGSTAERYVRGQIVMSLLIGVYTGITMVILGVHYALVLGVVAAILELVPMIGAVIALALAVLVAFLQSPGLGVASLVVGVVGHALEAYVVGPRVSGRMTGVHPLVAMSALLIGGEIGGVLGALFGVPVAAVANIALGAVYRHRQGDSPLTTDSKGNLDADNLPRLSEEIGGIDSEGIVSDPIPRAKEDGKKKAPRAAKGK